MKPLDLVITPGDPDGIGPEVTAKAIHALSAELKNHALVIVGSSAPFRRYQDLLKHNEIVFFEPPKRSSPGYQAGWAIETATQFVMAAPQNRVLVTGPISKERLQEGGYFFKGHTDFLADLTRTRDVTMMLANDLFKVTLVTNHCALVDVAKNITAARLHTTFMQSYAFAKDLLGKKNPRIAVLGLNPHAGENGILGKEEKKIIIPAMAAFAKKYPNAKLSGPHSADGFFANEAALPAPKRHDVIVAMFHDQGLIPVKLSDFSNSLNMTLGLPMIRTSVDHGTAFNIAKKNKADPSSMIYAIRKAIHYRNTLSSPRSTASESASTAKTKSKSKSKSTSKLRISK
jgi:4-hydroxythreonine-4-phosphate dehydrogenase